MEEQQLIFLIGFMGVGKTTLGKKLAKSLGLAFIDSDEELEKQFKLSIPDFFKQYGEATFRKKEQAWLERLDHKNAVISTGGGMPCFHGNIELMKEKGLVIYLERPAKEIVKRLEQGKNKRPLIAQKSEEELLEFVEDLLSKRSFYYEQADLTISREDQNVERMIELIKKQ